MKLKFDFSLQRDEQIQHGLVFGAFGSDTYIMEVMR